MVTVYIYGTLPEGATLPVSGIRYIVTVFAALVPFVLSWLCVNPIQASSPLATGKRAKLARH
jgi:hypothetical protein